ncbi:hypothetical protein [Vibrio sp. SCSIO 43155]|uniref:hypothetical protein n=1 Tax=Vibrio sp. SCSIO 43155 TaxID=2819099 RepID=UPI002075FEC6|nr:hypothetical protein [Vibrio sp. SCSIO 43155]USD58528.1 hypothetical protein J4N44_27935 [Vibrio sp. SCSIO 43155]
MEFNSTIYPNRRGGSKVEIPTIHQYSVCPFYFEAEIPLEPNVKDVSALQDSIRDDFYSNMTHSQLSANRVIEYLEWIFDKSEHDFSFLACFKAIGIDKEQAYDMAYNIIHKSLSIHRKRTSKNSQKIVRILNRTLNDLL